MKKIIIIFIVGLIALINNSYGQSNVNCNLNWKSLDTGVVRVSLNSLFTKEGSEVYLNEECLMPLIKKIKKGSYTLIYTFYNLEKDQWVENEKLEKILFNFFVKNGIQKDNLLSRIFYPTILPELDVSPTNKEIQNENIENKFIEIILYK